MIRLKECANKLKKPITLFCASLFLVCSFFLFPSSDVFAADVNQTLNKVFLMPMARPDIGKDCGYVDLLFKNDSTGDYFLRTVSWNIFASSDNVQSYMSILVDPDASVLFNPNADNFQSVTYTFRYSTNFVVNTITNSGSANRAYNYEFSGLTIAEAMYYGNVSDFSGITLNGSPNFTVIWAPDSQVYDLLKENFTAISSLLSTNNSLLNNLKSALGTSNTYLKNIDTNVEDLEGQAVEILDALSKITDKLTTNNNKVENTNEILRDIRTKLTDLNNQLTNVLTSLNSIDNKLTSTNNLLSDILEQLTVSVEEVEENVDKTVIDDYAAAEEEVLNNENNVSSEEVEDVLEEATTEATSEDNLDTYEGIFGGLDKLFAQHPDLQTTFITLLSLGLIALILGR